jgi:hypothetical protein
MNTSARTTFGQRLFIHGYITLLLFGAVHLDPDVRLHVRRADQARRGGGQPP